MSLYKGVSPRLPDVHVDLGWNEALHTYFVHAYEGSSRSNLVYAAGQEQPAEIPTLYALVNATWMVVDWPSEPALLEQLRDDPLHEGQAFLLEESMAGAERDTREELSSMIRNCFAAWDVQRSSGTANAPAGTISFDAERRRRNG